MNSLATVKEKQVVMERVERQGEENLRQLHANDKPS